MCVERGLSFSVSKLKHAAIKSYIVSLAEDIWRQLKTSSEKKTTQQNKQPRSVVIVRILGVPLQFFAEGSSRGREEEGGTGLWRPSYHKVLLRRLFSCV